jgi:threonine/homoserine efflux transporter RhtA
MLAITLALAGIYLPKLRAIGDAGAGSVGAIYAADSALEWCIYINRANPALPQPIMSNGATYTILPNVPNTCTILPLNNQAVGTYRNVSRSLEVTTQ